MPLENRTMPSGQEVILPKGDSPDRYKNLTPEERDQVYKSLLELSGDLGEKARTDLEEDIWEGLASPKLNYSLKKKEAELNGMPVSQAILDAMNQQFADKGLGARTPEQVMFYCLNYLQNASENRQGDKAIGASNMDKVEPGEYVEIFEQDGRWKLKVLADDGETVRMEGFLFPPKPEPKAKNKPEATSPEIKETEKIQGNPTNAEVKEESSKDETKIINNGEKLETKPPVVESTETKVTVREIKPTLDDRTYSLLADMMMSKIPPEMTPEMEKMGLGRDGFEKMFRAMPGAGDILRKAELTMPDKKMEEITDEQVAAYRLRAQSFRKDLVKREPRLEPMNQFFDVIIPILKEEIKGVDLSRINSTKDLENIGKQIGPRLIEKLQPYESTFDEKKVEDLMKTGDMEVILAFFSSGIQEISLIGMEHVNKDPENFKRLMKILEEESVVG
ncbi:MAG: hypothetical protein WC882_02655 [Candidatus Gracilibacteria bacterium]